jgi:molecular chaperone GrpE
MTEEQPKPQEAAPAPAQQLVEDELTHAKKEASEYKDKYLRALAEIENTRKRLSKEKLESQSFAVQNIVADLLQPIDHFEQALKHAESANKEIAHWAFGFEMILNQLRSVLTDHGVVPYESKGMIFDPHLHEAVETEERADVAEGTIIEEFQKGYKLAGRTIRAARVKVATRPNQGKEKPQLPPQEKN